MTATAAKPERPGTAPPADHPIKLLLYGVSGSGKTRLALSATLVAAMSPVLVLDVERGLIGIDPAKEWTALPINTLADAEGALERMRSYRTVVVDSLSRLQRIAIQATAATRTGGRPNDDVQIQDYGKVLTRLTNLLDILQRAPQNVILITGQKFTYAKESTRQNPVYDALMPDLDGKVLDRAQETADFVWALMEANDRRFLLTRPRPPYRIKSRRLLTTGVDEKGVMPDANLERVYAAFQSSFPR